MGWIRVEDGLPKAERMACWVTRYSLFHDSYYTSAKIWLNGGFFGFPFNVVAWMPKSESESKPEPYRRKKIQNETFG